MSGQPTPGPWELEEQWHGTAIKARGGRETVARVSRRDADPGNEIANSYLIRSSHDLLEALEKLRDAVIEAYAQDEHGGDGGPLGMVDGSLVGKANRAIARAKGRQAKA